MQRRTRTSLSRGLACARHGHAAHRTSMRLAGGQGWLKELLVSAASLVACPEFSTVTISFTQTLTEGRSLGQRLRSYDALEAEGNEHLNAQPRFGQQRNPLCTHNVAPLDRRDASRRPLLIRRNVQAGLAQTPLGPIISFVKSHYAVVKGFMSIGGAAPAGSLA